MHRANIKLVTAFAATTTVQSRIMWHLLFRYEWIFIFLLVLLFSLYVKFMINYHEHRLKAQNLVQYDMMRSLKFEKPQFIDIGFKDLACTPDRVWRLKHRNFSYCAAQGFRSYQEDRMHYMHDPANGNLSIFSIFDGHGGPYVSEYLERHFSRRIRERLVYRSGRLRKLSTTSYSGDWDERYIEAIVTEVHKIDDQISMLDPSRISYTGSTLISAIFEQNRYLTVVNVGDSRAIACDLVGKARPLSKDHKPSDTEERQRIENAGGFIQHYGVDRVQGILAVSRQMKRKAKIEVVKDLPEDIKRSMIEELYRIGWDASKIIKETSMPRSTVYDNIKRFEEKGTTRRSNDAGTRLKVIERARKYGSESAAKNFNVDAPQIKDWVKGNWGLAFGDTALKRAKVLTAHPDVERIDLVKEPLKYLIVASDGFWDVFENQEAIDFANDYLKAHPNRWSQAATYLVDAALGRNTQDNVSVLFVRLTS